MIIHGHKISRSMLAAVIVCLFLPFLTVSCGAQEFTITGSQFVTGIHYKGESIPPQGPIVLMTLASIVALALSFVNKTGALLGAVGASILSVLCLLWFREGINREVFAYGGMIHAKFEAGFWLCFLLHIGAAALNGWLWKQGPQALALANSAHSLSALPQSPQAASFSVPPTIALAQQEHQCSNCGEQLKATSRFCMKCGQAVQVK